MDREILADGLYGDVSNMVFDLRVTASRTVCELFKEFTQVEHYKPRSVD
jgi:hypothetical protein